MLRPAERLSAAELVAAAAAAAAVYAVTCTPSSLRLICGGHPHPLLELCSVPNYIRWTNSSSHRSNDLPWSAVISLVDSHAAVVINVMHGEHFVLVVGYDKRVGGDTLYVNDPGFNRPSYSYAKDVVGYRLFDITSVQTE